MEATGPGKGQNGKPPKRYMRNYLLDKRFQLKWVLGVVLIAVVVVAVLGHFLHRTVVDATDQMVAQKMGEIGLTEEATQAFIERAQKDKAYTLWVLVGCLSGLIVFLALVTVVVTHRIAGPVYKLKKLFSDIDGGRLQLWASLRKGDELQDIFQAFSDMLKRLRESRREDIAKLEALQGSVADEEARSVLESMLERYRDSVKMG